jgi:4-amino-4-deoxy-L-arabinose transferase-like glycosyltransferase
MTAMTENGMTEELPPGPPRARREPEAALSGRVVLGLAALALVARLVWILAVPTRPVGDFAMYWESAGYFAEHGAFDPEFIFMPGYVLALAAIRWLGGGLLAAKLLGVGAGVLATVAVTGTAARLFGRAAAVVAGALCALWPAGIAVASVTGTDMPAAALGITAVWLLLRDADARPVRAAIVFGVVLGVAATVRAVALPLVVLAAPIWWARHAAFAAGLRRTALSCAIAFSILLPWGVRNEARYGELFFTDSHGGHTALVGANPNTEGVYSRSLNLMFMRATGYEMLEPPHRESDRAAYALARRWTAFEPDYALGLLAAKADRLLGHERSLLYWPLFRQGVLPPDTLAAFAEHRAGLEAFVDLFWFALVGAALFGVAVALSRRVLVALALLPIPLALAALYVAFFAEVRYQLAIAVFLFPFAGLAWRWLAQTLRDGVGGRFNERGRRRLLRELAGGLSLVVALFIGWPRLVAAGADLRERHRWAVAVCEVAGHAQICDWKSTVPAPGEGASAVRGVWNGVGLKLSTALAAAATDVDVPPGRYVVSVTADTPATAPAPEIRLSMRARGVTLASTTLPQPAGTAPARLSGVVEHLGGPMRVELGAERLWLAPTFYDLPAVWVSDLKIEADVH